MKKLTILFAAIMLVCFAVPAMAIDWNFYGNARMATFWESRDFGDGTNAAPTAFMTNYLGLAAAVHNPYQSSSATQISFDTAGSLAGRLQYTENSLVQAQNWDHLTPGGSAQISATANETTYGTKTVGIENIGASYRTFFWRSHRAMAASSGPGDVRSRI